MLFSEMMVGERPASVLASNVTSESENTVSLIVSSKTRYLFNLYDLENPIKLAFPSRYGSIMAYNWFGEGYILIMFSLGYFIIISTHIKEIWQELFQVKNHKESLTADERREVDF